MFGVFTHCSVYGLLFLDAANLDNDKDIDMIKVVLWRLIFGSRGWGKPSFIVLRVSYLLVLSYFSALVVLFLLVSVATADQRGFI